MKRRVFAVALAIVVLIFLVQTMLSLPFKPLNERASARYVQKNVLNQTDAFEETSANLVTSVVLSYRGLDTLGEVTVLFAAASGVAFFMRALKERLIFPPSNFVARIGSKVVAPLLVTLGIYIFVHGHLTPGGGFQGGTVIAVTTLFAYVTDSLFQLKTPIFKALEGASGGIYVLLGLMGLAVGGAFLYNYLPLGKMGNLFSAGLVPVFYVLIGLKVGSELSNLIANMMGGDEV